MPASQQVVYKDFSKGEYGNADLFSAPPGTFHAKNLLRSRGGVLLPRPGAEGYVTTGLPNGTSHALGWTGVPGRDLWTLVGQTVYHRNSTLLGSGSWTAATGTLTAEPNEQLSWIEVSAGIVYILSPGNGLYVLNLTSAPGTLTKVAAVTADMAGRPLSVWGERLFIGGWNPANRVYYSNANDFATWPAGNYFPVGGAPQVRFLGAQRGHLAIALQDGSWWVMNGSTPTTGTLRRVVSPQGSWHFWQNSAVVLADDMTWIVPLQGSWPAGFDGVSIADLRHLEYATVQGSIQGEQNVINVHERSDVAYVSGRPGERGEAMFLLGGVWTKHVIGGDVAGGVATDGQGHIFLHDAGGPASLEDVIRLNMKNPGTPGGTAADSRPGDVSSTPLDTFLELPGFWSEDGQEFRVRQIIVDGWKWNLGVVVDNELDVELDVYSHDRSEKRTLAIAAWTEASSAAAAGGERFRHYWNVGSQGYGAGMQVRFPQLTGVGIEQVIVKIERSAGRPRA